MFTALAIYHDAEAKPMFKDYTTYEQLNSAIISLLTKKQGREFDELITEMSRKVSWSSQTHAKPKWHHIVLFRKIIFQTYLIAPFN